MFRTRNARGGKKAARCEKNGGSPGVLAGFAREDLASQPLKHPPEKSRQLRRLVSLIIVFRINHGDGGNKNVAKQKANDWVRAF